jgi:hypothetical protein
VLNFMMQKSFTTNSMVLRRTRDLHLIGHRIEPYKIFYTQNRLRRNVLQRVRKVI